MAIIVQKFGGTSLATTKLIADAAKLVVSEKSSGNQVIVVVSAMAGVTNHLITLCNEISELKEMNNLAEYDAALSTGEVVSAALIALALQELGMNARSINAWQLPIITNSCYTQSLVESCNNKLLYECLESDIIPIITGFQGINTDNRITTLGRGGSDTTAALIAAAVKADRCDIYTDVDGVYSADPRIVHNAKILSKVYNLEMLEFAASGAKVLHARSVEIAIRYNITLRILSSFSHSTFSNCKGTLITKEKDMEQDIITGITCNKNLLKATITLSSMSYIKLLEAIGISGITIDYMINSTNSVCQLIVPIIHKAIFENILIKLKADNKIKDFTINTRIAVIAVVGFGIKHNPLLLQRILAQLEHIQLDIDMLNISETKIAILASEDKAEEAVKALHELISLK